MSGKNRQLRETLHTTPVRKSGTHNVTIRTGGGTNAGQLSITEACESPANLLKFFDLWYTGETVMQLQYGPIDVYFTGQDENGVWLSITEDEAKEKYNKGAGELKGENEVWGPKLILSDYYSTTFKMEDRAIERLTDLYEYWMPYVDDPCVYPVDCVFTADELDACRRNEVSFEGDVKGTQRLDGFTGRLVDLELEIDVPDEAASYRKFSGSRRAVIHQRRAKVSLRNGKLKLRVILDRYSVEVFINDGEQAMSAVIYTDLAADEICFVSEGKTRIRATKWDLKV